MEEHQTTKKRKIDQVTSQQSELDINCNGGSYYMVTTNEDHLLNYYHQFLLPENTYNKYAQFISNFKPKNDVSDYKPFTNKEIESFKDLEAIKDFFLQCDLEFPINSGEDSKHYDEDAPFDDEFTFDYLWFKIVDYWFQSKQVIKLKHENRINNIQELNVLFLVFDYDK